MSDGRAAARGLFDVVVAAAGHKQTGYGQHVLSCCKLSGVSASSLPASSRRVKSPPSRFGCGVHSLGCALTSRGCTFTVLVLVLVLALAPRTPPPPLTAACSWWACSIALAVFDPPQSLVPTITCTSSNVLHTVLQAFAQVSGQAGRQTVASAVWIVPSFLMYFSRC